LKEFFGLDKTVEREENVEKLAVVVDRDLIRRLGNLAQLEIPEEETPQLTRDIREMIQFVDKIHEKDTQHLPRTSYIISETSYELMPQLVHNEEELETHTKIEHHGNDLLNLAPCRENNYYVVIPSSSTSS
jgi:aspartyl/glutamyl-tRNA(Asn/Gln) amidotransferase C subunit